jgi:hypothetical protein
MRAAIAVITGLLKLNQMIRCDNDECPLRRDCARHLIYPADEDGLKRYTPKNDKECDFFIEHPQYPDNNN